MSDAWKWAESPAYVWRADDRSRSARDLPDRLDHLLIAKAGGGHCRVMHTLSEEPDAILATLPTLEAAKATLLLLAATGEYSR